VASTRTEEVFACSTPAPAQPSFRDALQLGSFWSFLFALSGIFDITIGFLVWTGFIPIKSTTVPVFEICFLVGAIFLVTGFVFTLVKTKN